MQQYNSNCTSQMNWFDLAGIPCLVFEPATLKAFKSIQAILLAPFKEEPQEGYLSERSDVPLSWNTYWPDTAREGSGLDTHDVVFGQHFIKYKGLKVGLITDCDPNKVCDCEGHNCVGEQSTVGHTAAAATTAKSLGVPLMVVVPPTPTHYGMDIYVQYW